MKVEDLEKNGLAQWPQVMGGVVLVVNLQGIAPEHVSEAIQYRTFDRTLWV